MTTAAAHGMLRYPSLALALGFLASGCGGSVEGGSPGSGGSAGGGSAPTCKQLPDGLAVTVSPAPLECKLMSSDSQVWDTSGAITQASENAFVLDTCPPNADCMPNLVNVSLEAAGLSFQPSVGAFVKLHYELTFAWSSCGQQLMIENLPSWGGATNPVSAEARLLFAGSEGRVDPPEGVGFSVATKDLGCFPGAKSTGQTPPASFTLVFTGDGAPVTLGMGQSGTFTANGRTLTARNQRSFLTGYFDDYWDWSWWVTAESPATM